MTELDLAEVRDETPSQNPSKPPTFTDKAGVDIIKILLWILVGVFIFFAAIYFTQNHTKANVLSEIVSRDTTAFNLKFKTVSAEYQEDRDFILSVIQLILINFLLPIITALLGYIFGVSQKR